MNMKMYQRNREYGFDLTLICVRTLPSGCPRLLAQIARRLIRAGWWSVRGSNETLDVCGPGGPLEDRGGERAAINPEDSPLVGPLPASIEPL